MVSVAMQSVLSCLPVCLCACKQNYSETIAWIIATMYRRIHMGRVEHGVGTYSETRRYLLQTRQKKQLILVSICPVLLQCVAYSRPMLERCLRIKGVKPRVQFRQSTRAAQWRMHNKHAFPICFSACQCLCHSVRMLPPIIQPPSPPQHLTADLDGGFKVLSHHFSVFQCKLPQGVIYELQALGAKRKYLCSVVITIFWCTHTRCLTEMLFRGSLDPRRHKWCFG